MYNVPEEVKWNACKANQLVKYGDGLQVSGQFCYNGIVGMLQYLAGNTLPGISYEVNCSTIYMFGPRNYHALALKRVGCYLKATQDKGLMLNPSSSLCKLDLPPETDF